MTKIRKKIGNIPINTIKQDLQSTVDASVAQMQQDVTDFINEETAQYPEIGGAFKFQKNPEYISAETDSEGKILSGRKTDGTKFENIGFESAKVATDNLEVAGTDITENVNAIKGTSYHEDPEGRSEVTTDAEGKIISYRDADGVKHENVGINTPTVVTGNLEMSSSGLTDFGNALKANGFTIDEVNDFSGAEAVEFPEPEHYGMLNLIIPTLPVNDDDVYDGYAEYYDFYGNYFKKSCEITPQGQTSKTFAKTGGKGNYTLDITDGSEIKFGTWVPQDSFHLKGCAKDCTRGLLATSYKFAYKIMQALDAKPNRVLMDESAITTTAATGDRFTDWPSDARCLPDGFPVEIYINGEYWGLYSLQLKKHRKNYSMDKKDYESFILDADEFGGFWQGNIPWTGFEIRNPKDLYCMDGSKYDGDNPQELIDDTAVGIYDPNNSKHVGSARTKSIIESFPTKYLEVKTYIDNNDLVTAKEKFGEYFDVNSCIFVYIFNCLLRNSDSINKNTLWATWSDGKIAPMLWDLDSVYGQDWLAIKALAPSAFMWAGIYATSAWPLAELWTLYQAEIKAAYASLRTEGLISVEAWHDVMFGQWVDRIGKEAFERDIKKWKETTSYRENYTNTEYWQEVTFINGTGTYSVWNESSSYAIGDRCVIRMHAQASYYMVYEAVKASTNVCPVTKFYTQFPIVGGFYDSPKRMEKWMESQIALCDGVMDYSEG